MKNPEIVQLTGVIKHKPSSQGNLSKITFMLLDEEGRLLSIKYTINDFDSSQNMYASLNEGQRVKVHVKGPIQIDTETYEGVGFVTFLEKSQKDRMQPTPYSRG